MNKYVLQFVSSFKVKEEYLVYWWLIKNFQQSGLQKTLIRLIQSGLSGLEWKAPPEVKSAVFTESQKEPSSEENTCEWQWMEWSSCSVFCNLDGTMPEDAPTTKKREKKQRLVKVPQELCQGEQEENCTQTTCIGKVSWFFVPINVIFWWTFKSLEPFLFGDWTRFPGGRGPYCNASCGSHRYYLKQRSCTPTRIDLPQGYSCESLDDSLTWASSSTPCEPFVPCKGEVATFFYKVEKRSSWR